jgi:putative OPT family oligopeptide transporter
MKAIVQGVFDRNLPWLMIGIGAALAICVIGLDVVLELQRTRFRVPVLAVAVGLYLPLELGSAIFMGGLVAWLARRGAPHGLGEPSTSNQRRGVLFASGLITGEALLDILLAVPIVITSGKNLFEVRADMLPLMWPAGLWLAVVGWSLYAIGCHRRPDAV